MFGSFTTAACLFLAALTSASSPPPSYGYGSGSCQETNQKLFDSFVHLLYVKKDVDTAFAKYVSPSFVSHDPNLPPNVTEQAFLKEIFPGVDIRLQRKVLQGNYGAVFITVDGAPTPNDTAEIMDFWRIEKGKFVELWEALEVLPKGFEI